MPLVGGDLPYLTGMPAGDEVSLFGRDEAHAGLFRDAAGGEVAHGLGRAEDWETEDVEPEIVDCDYGLGHQALTVPGKSKPEAAIVGPGSILGVGSMQTDGSDVFLGRLPESQRPLPFVAAFDGGDRDVTVEGESAVCGVGPGNIWVKMFDDLPMGKEKLGLLGVRELERAQEESRGVEFDGGGAGRHGRDFLRKVYLLTFWILDAVGVSEHFTPVSVSSQWQAFQSVWALVQIAVAFAGWLVRS